MPFSYGNFQACSCEITNLYFQNFMTSEAVEKQTDSPPDNFFAVGVGASSGGLDAFKQLLKEIPLHSGLAFILVQHLDPSHDSILVEILQKFTSIPVREITNNLHVDPDHIYVIPSNKLLTASDGVLKLAVRSADPNENNHSIDLFLTSLAEVYQTQSIGVVMSGTGIDGTDGLRVIKKYGGITFAQSLDTAGYPAMPRNAIHANVVDFELSPEAIIKSILNIQQSILKSFPADVAPGPKAEEMFFSRILSMLDLRKGIDFTYYKQTTIRRRIARRMVLMNFSKIGDYFNYLEKTEPELDLLLQDILIPVTEFFRDHDIFESLRETALPAMIKDKTANESLRIWTVGCSTGQETFSLAILLCEHFEGHNQKPKIQIFATDISEIAIRRARTGFYSTNDTIGISQERLEKFFTKTENGYQINKSIRDLCVFAIHNVLTNPPFAGIDLISCRNVLIYMDAFLQRKAMATFHYSLNEKGILLLGRSESSGNSSDLFSAVSESDKIYKRNLVPGRYIHMAAKRRAEFFENNNLKASKDERPKDDFQKSAEDMILAKSPDGVIANDHLEIVHFRGATGNWIEPAEGKPSLNVLKMVKRELAVELRSLIHKAKTTMVAAQKEGIVMQFSGSKKLVSIEVIPLLNTINLYFLILFKNTMEIMSPEIAKGNGTLELTPGELRSQQLERELLQTREDMRTITEDQEAGNEELLSANEELLSSSEELRSLNEELEISKEELQSTVEELSVSNQELAFRIDQLNYSRIYSEAIITTIREPLIVLDNELRIKSANDSFYKAFQLAKHETEGKFFYELGNHQWDIPDLRNILARTLQENGFFESFEIKIKVSDDARIMILNSRKIQSEASSEQLVLLVMEDVTERRQLENSLKEKAEYLRGLLESSPQISATALPDGKVTYYNNYFLNYAGLNLSEALDQGWKSVIHPDDVEPTEKAWAHSVATGEEFYKEVRFKRHDDEYRWHISRALATWNSEGKITSWVGTAADIHEQKMFSEELEKKVKRRTQSLKQSNIDLEHSNKNLEQFAFIASHDLQEPLRKIQTFSGMLSDNFKNQLPADAVQLISKISTSSRRMSALITDVLNFSRIAKGANAYEAANLSDILNNVLVDFSLLIEEKTASVQIGEFPVAEVIPFQISQLFYNLLSNSLKFTKEGVTPKINITSRQLSSFEVAKYLNLNKNHSYLEILFEDNGIGFDQKYSEKIFEIFQRLNDRTSYAGTGIGLALCKKIVAIHRGEIFAESRAGQGTLVHIILPVKYTGTLEKLLPGYVQ
jgi:two-component system CheB/CheR fusion protein